jgi:tetratricopeptide (TPR) repeat protein
VEQAIQVNHFPELSAPVEISVMETPRNGKIISFYSYKGGTGRSMAMVNVAWILASKGKKVLMIDWDLEAPGLHRYIHPFIDDKELASSEGVIDFVVKYAAKAMAPPPDPLPKDWYVPYANILRYVMPLKWEASGNKEQEFGQIHFVPSGRQGIAYSIRVNTFDWQKFYDKFGGYDFIEAAKLKMKSEYDYILIDSRTGLSDTAGICTVQLPDILVVCFTFNNQSIEGAAAVAESVFDQRQDDEAFQIFPIPMRVELGETDRLDLARVTAVTKFSRYLRKFSEEEQKKYWGHIEVLYKPIFAYEEFLAPFAEKQGQLHSVLSAMERITGYITGNDVSALATISETDRLSVHEKFLRSKRVTTLNEAGLRAAGLPFYISYALNDASEHLEKFIADLSTEVRRLTGSETELNFYHRRRNDPGDDWSELARRGLENGRVIIPILSPSYVASDYCGKELQLFLHDKPLLSWSAGGDSVDLAPVLPVWWMPTRSEPLEELRTNWLPSDSMSSISQEGVYSILRDPGLKDQYDSFIRQFSAILVQLMNRFASFVPSPPKALLELQSAFAGHLDVSKHDVFLSYASTDRTAVSMVRDQLQTRGISTFVDRGSVKHGQPWVQSLDEAISRSKAVIVFIGPEELGRWQKRELIIALDRQASAEKTGAFLPVVPVLLPGADPERVPAFLLFNDWVDLRHGIGNTNAELDPLARVLTGNGQTYDRLPKEIPCPYRGLRQFREEDAPFFFGRYRLSSELVDRVSKQRFVTVIGSSGSGKSSVLQAGLFPLLRRQRQPEWETVTFTPGRRPYHRFAAAVIPLLEPETRSADRQILAEKLAEGLEKGYALWRNLIETIIARLLDAGRLLIVIDQFEELFTHSPEPVRKSFVTELMAAIENLPVTLVIALRADFYGLAIGLAPNLNEAIQQGIVNVGPLRREELKEAIEFPARAVGLALETGLTERILDHVQEQPGGLALLEFALTELYDRRDKNLLTHQAYEQIGGVAGAIGARAEQVYSTLAPEQQRSALRLFLRLIRIASNPEEGSDTSQSIRITELDELTIGSVRAFVDARLLVTSRSESHGENLVEVAHLVLFRSWARLADYLNQDREFLLWRQRLGARLADWERAEQDDFFLLRGVLLQEAQAWQSERTEDLLASELDLIDRSISDSESRSDDIGPKIRFGAVILLLICALGVGGWIWTRSNAYQIAQIQTDGETLVPGSADTTAMAWITNMVLLDQQADRALISAGRIQKAAEQSLAYAAIAEALSMTGSAEMMRSTADSSIIIAGRIDDHEDRSRTYAAIARILSRAGAADKALVAADSALLSAVRIDTARDQSHVLAAIAIILTKAGLAEKGLVAANLAIVVAGRIIDPEDQSSTYAMAAESLAKAGAADRAIAIAGTIKDPKVQSTTYAVIAEALSNDGARDKALVAADLASVVVNRIESPRDRLFAYIAVAEALSIAGSADKAQIVVDSALVAAGMLEDRDYRSRVYAMIAEVIAKAGAADKALLVAGRIDNPNFQLLTYAAVAGILSQAGVADKALAAADSTLAVAGRIKDSDLRSEAYAMAAEVFATSGSVDRAMAAASRIEDPYTQFRAYLFVMQAKAIPPDAVASTLDSALNIVAKITSDIPRSEALALIAQIQAQRGELREARLTADQCITSNERLWAYSAILHAYVKQQDPVLKKRLEEEERDLVGE